MKATCTGRDSIILMLMFAVTLGVFASCTPRDPLVDRVAELEANGVAGEEVDDARIEELERDIKRYREVVDAKVQANGQLMIYYRMLGLRYLEREMYGPALDALQEALAITPANAKLHGYYAAAAAQTAKGKYDGAERQQLFATAEEAYKRAIELDARLDSALYGLSVLLVFELSRPADALPYLDSLIQQQTRTTEGRFVRAYAHAALGNTQEAIADYEEIIDISNNSEVRSRALSLRDELLGRSQ